eukprot:1156676-Pelagomonas_calceolata.AAC.1
MQVPLQSGGFAHVGDTRQSKECLVHSLDISPYTMQSLPQIISEFLQGNRCTLLIAHDALGGSKDFMLFLSSHQPGTEPSWGCNCSGTPNVQGSRDQGSREGNNAGSEETIQMGGGKGGTLAKSPASISPIKKGKICRERRERDAGRLAVSINAMDGERGMLSERGMQGGDAWRECVEGMPWITCDPRVAPAGNWPMSAGSTIVDVVT